MRIVLLILLCCGMPTIVGGANYNRIANGMRVVENKNGKITVIERSNRFKKLFYFISSYPKVNNKLETTELIYSCEYPEVMAAIASVESGFDSNAVGKYKEVSAWQILHWKSGNPTNNKDGLNAALKVFKEKLLETTSLSIAIERYNGTGVKAKKYRKLVLQKMYQIKSIKV